MTVDEILEDTPFKRIEYIGETDDYKVYRLKTDLPYTIQTGMVSLVIERNGDFELFTDGIEGSVLDIYNNIGYDYLSPDVDEEYEYKDHDEDEDGDSSDI